MDSALQFQLEADDPNPVAILRPEARGPYVLLGDHAGNAVPRALLALQLPAHELERHIGWDIGVRALGTRMSQLLDATFVHQHYSRLVADCNRHPDAEACVAEVSDGTPIPGNRGLSPSARDARIAHIHAPYHAAISDVLNARSAARQTIVLSLHSFTPRLKTADAESTRPWHVGVLFDTGDTRVAKALLARLRTESELCVGDNEPYRMDQTDYTVPFHTGPRGLPYVELEVRQDLLADTASIEQMATLLARAFSDVAASLSG